jgi:NAD(P)-dependent dehydrogenase (short-subunit alcohol dehydrogenase family)
MDLGRKDQVAIVTGASQGIGLAIAQGLVEEGAHVIAGSRGSSAESPTSCCSSPATARTPSPAPTSGSTAV